MTQEKVADANPEASWAIIPSLVIVELIAIAAGWGIPHLASQLVAPHSTYAATFLLFALSSICLPFVAIWQARFILRALPTRSDGARCYSCLLAIVLIVAAILLVFSLGSWKGSGLAGLPLTVPLVIGASFFLVLHRHLRPRRFQDRPFILYLRRFSGFADRAGVLTVLRAAKPGTPVVFLLAPDTGLGYWDPFLVAFAGCSLRHPWRSSPIFLRSTNEKWEADVRMLAASATAVIIDITESSKSMTKEIEIARQNAANARVVWLTARSSPSEASPERMLQGMWPSIQGPKVVYDVSWKRALPRMILGFLVLYLSMTTLLALGAGLFGVLFEMILRLLVDLVGMDLGSLARLGAIALIVTPLWAFTFANPLINKADERKIMDSVSVNR